MSSANAIAVSAFIEGAPPGEVGSPSSPPPAPAPAESRPLQLGDVISDIKSLTGPDSASLLKAVEPAFRKYAEAQLLTAKLPSSSSSGVKTVLVSKYNSLGGGRYFDPEAGVSWAFDYVTGEASHIKPHTLESEHKDLISALHKSLSAHAREHYPSFTIGVFPPSDSSYSSSSSNGEEKITMLLVANKYSPSNFWNGRYRSTYLLHPTNSTISGNIKVDVHYYEDGNVRLSTTKNIPESLPKSSHQASGSLVQQIAGWELAYQEELTRGFVRLSEGSFKGLRRQLPITRQKVEWEKVGGYRLGQDIGGGRTR